MDDTKPGKSGPIFKYANGALSGKGNIFISSGGAIAGVAAAIGAGPVSIGAAIALMFELNNKDDKEQKKETDARNEEKRK